LIFGFNQLAQEGFNVAKVPSSSGAHLPRIPGDIQSSVETEPDIERGPLRRPPKRWTKSVILPRT
jgi:hypothetical protein